MSDRSSPRTSPSAVILCETTDAPALWAAAELQSLGVRCDIILAPLLGASVRFEHALDANGRGEISIDLPDGRRLSTGEPVPILNRLMTAPLDRLRATGGEDFSYAMQEVFAMHLSWLHLWPAKVINRPTPQGLCGNFRHPSAWVAMAVAAGLAVEPWRQSAGDGPELAWVSRRADARAFVVEDKVLLGPDLPGELSGPCAALARESGAALLGVDFARDDEGDWSFTTASPFPLLQAGGEPLVAALAEALT